MTCNLKAAAWVRFQRRSPATLSTRPGQHPQGDKYVNPLSKQEGGGGWRAKGALHRNAFFHFDRRMQIRARIGVGAWHFKAVCDGFHGEFLTCLFESFHYTASASAVPCASAHTNDHLQ